jgi:hypothetical protein
LLPEGDELPTRFGTTIKVVTPVKFVTKLLLFLWGKKAHWCLPNVEIIRDHEGAARAPHETCLMQASDAMIG